MISSGNSYRLDQSLAIWFPSRKRLLPPLELVWMELSIPCGPLNMPWRCSGGRYRLVPHAVVSTGSPIASQRSSPKRANSARPESGQTLAGYVVRSRMNGLEWLPHQARRAGHRSLSYDAGDDRLCGETRGWAHRRDGCESASIDPFGLGGER